LDLYRSVFENQLLEESAVYYRSECARFLAESKSSDFMFQVEVRLHEEEDRVNRYMHRSSMAPLMQRLVDVFVLEQKDALQTNFRPFLKDDRDEDLGRMYRLLGRIPHGHDKLWGDLESWVGTCGQAAVAAIAEEVKNDAQRYVETLLS